MIKQEGTPIPVRQLSFAEVLFPPPPPVVSKDTLLTPELIPGHPFRVAELILSETGNGYDLRNLALPEGWQEVGDTLHKIDWHFRKRVMDYYCEHERLPQPTLTIDSVTGLLTRMEIPDPEGGLGSIDLGQDGRYHADGIINIRIARVLQVGTAKFLEILQSQRGIASQYAYIEGERGSYASSGLVVPSIWRDDEHEVSEQKLEGPLTDGAYQRKFVRRADAFAAHFKNRTKLVRFNERGVLDHISLREGNACEFNLEHAAQGTMYGSHNVDSIEQAVALHGIAAMFINDMLDAGHSIDTSFRFEK